MNSKGEQTLATAPDHFDISEWPFWPTRPALVWDYKGIQCAYVYRPGWQQAELGIPADFPQELQDLLPKDAYCGYIKIPVDHPWRRLDSYGDIDVDVHGSLTYGPECSIADHSIYDSMVENGTFPQELADRMKLSRLGMDRIVYWEDVGSWIGFDCQHYNDPGMWSGELVIAETNRLAQQAAYVRDGLKPA